MCLPTKLKCIQRNPEGFHGPIKNQEDLERYAKDHPNRRNSRGETAHEEFRRVSREQLPLTMPESYIRALRAERGF